MKYCHQTAFRILDAMERYVDETVPSPHEALMPETGRPKPSASDAQRAGVFGSGPPRSILNLDQSRTVEPRPQTPIKTDAASWVGEMDTAELLAHARWLKEERFITVSSRGYPAQLTMAGVKLLKEVQAKGGWENASKIAKGASAAATLTSMLAVLRKAKVPR